MEKYEPKVVLTSILGRFLNGDKAYGLLPGKKEKIIGTLRDMGVSVDTIVNDKEQTLANIKKALGNLNVDCSRIEGLLPEISEAATCYLCTCQGPGYLR